jgi:hypothetical protein
MMNVDDDRSRLMRAFLRGQIATRERRGRMGKGGWSVNPRPEEQG